MYVLFIFYFYMYEIFSISKLYIFSLYSSVYNLFCFTVVSRPDDVYHSSYNLKLPLCEVLLTLLGRNKMLKHVFVWRCCCCAVLCIVCVCCLSKCIYTRKVMRSIHSSKYREKGTNVRRILTVKCIPLNTHKPNRESNIEIHH